MTCDTETHGSPYLQAEAKRSWDVLRYGIDWHDWLARLWAPGRAFATGTVVRLKRGVSYGQGLQFRATTGGVTGGKEPRWPQSAGLSIPDGTVVWTTEAQSVASLEATITDSQWPTVTGVTLASPLTDDLRTTILVSAGTDGQTYSLLNQITLSTGERKEGVLVLPVLD